MYRKLYVDPTDFSSISVYRDCSCTSLLLFYCPKDLKNHSYFEEGSAMYAPLVMTTMIKMLFYTF